VRSDELYEQLYSNGSPRLLLEVSFTVYIATQVSSKVET